MVRSTSLVTLLALVAGCGGSSPPARTARVGPANRFVSIEVQSAMGASFELVQVRALLDGAEVHLSRTADPRDASSPPVRTPLCAARAIAQAGTHEVELEVGLRGHGHGIFSYLRNYRFTERSRTLVDISPDAFGVVVTGTVYEAGGATTPLEDRPRIRWQAQLARAPGAGCFP